MMKKLTVAVVGFIVVVGILVLWRSGVLGSIEAIGSLVVAFLLGAHTKHTQDIEEAKKAAKEAVERLKQQEEAIRAQREAHDREVREVEAAYSDAAFDELLAGANKRERRRKTGHMGK
jgi:preprotein translocase subunit SecF